MSALGNQFSLLNLDAEDDSVNTDATAASDDGKQNGNSSGGGVMPKAENGDKETSKLRLPLVWIDLEMTGLQVEYDRILEIACVVTDGSLTKLIEGPDLVIHQPKECLDKMGDWCQEHHSASGLIEKVLESNMSEEEAEQKVIEFVKKHVGEGVGARSLLLAGNSIYVDLSYLKKYMPTLAELFSHILVDVSSIKALCIRWYPKDNRNAPRKECNHRAMDDIKESIAELKYFKENIFKPMRRRRR